MTKGDGSYCLPSLRSALHFATGTIVTGQVDYALTGIAPLRTVLALFTHTALRNMFHLSSRINIDVDYGSNKRIALQMLLKLLPGRFVFLRPSS